MLRNTFLVNLTPFVTIFLDSSTQRQGHDQSIYERVQKTFPRAVIGRYAVISDNLLRASLAFSTRRTYKSYWDRFTSFCLETFHISGSPASAEMVSQFIAYQYELQYSPSTIASHLSAVSFFHKLQGFSDPCQTFIVLRVLLGCKKYK